MLHADPPQDLATRRLLLGVGESELVDRGPLDVARVEGLVDEPGACDRVAVDRGRLADVALRLGTLRLGTLGSRPGRTRHVDAGSPAGHTKGDFISDGVTVGETERVRDGAGLVEVELAERVEMRVEVVFPSWLEMFRHDWKNSSSRLKGLGAAPLGRNGQQRGQIL